MKVVVYTKENCPQCERVKATFDKHNFEYEVFPIDERVLKLANVKGWMQAPIVVSHGYPEYSFSGAQPHQIEDFILKHKEG